MRLMDIWAISLFNGSEDRKWRQWLEKTNKSSKLGAAGQLFRVLACQSRLLATFTARGSWFSWVGRDYPPLRHLPTFPKRINKESTLPSVPGAHFSKQIVEKRLLILLRGFRWLQSRFNGGWKLESWQICFIANKIPVVVRAAGIIWHDFHASVRSAKNLLRREKWKHSRITLASSIPWALYSLQFPFQ